MICWLTCTPYEQISNQKPGSKVGCGPIAAGDGGDRAVDAGAVRAGTDPGVMMHKLPVGAMVICLQCLPWRRTGY